MIENKQQVSLIEADKQISLFCPLGDDYYTANIHIKFAPDNYYMDYIDLDVFFNNMGGMKLTIEDAADMVYKELQRYKPKKTKVSIVAFSNTHLNVTVTKGDEI